MKVEVIILNNYFQPSHTIHDEFNTRQLLNFARNRQNTAAIKGEIWAKEGLSAFGLQVVKSAANKNSLETTHMISQLVVAIITYEMTFLNSNESIYKDYTMKIIINQYGMVSRTV